MKKILVTGATGVLGYNLVKELVTHDNAEITLHIGPSGFPAYQCDILKPCVTREFDADLTDIRDVKYLGGAIRRKFDEIYHFAGYGQPKKFGVKPHLTFYLNTCSIEYLLDYKLKQDGRFVFMSSSEVYGAYANPTENDAIVVQPENPRSCYKSGKLCGEEILRYSGFNSTVLRICLAYGPGFKVGDTRVMYELIHKALTAKKIELMDDGSAWRNYIYIDDALNMMYDIIAAKEPGFQLYNIGGNTPVRIIDIANIIGKLTDTPVIPGPREGTLEGSPAYAGVSIDKVQGKFGKYNFTDLETGIGNCIDWYGKLLRKDY